MIWPDLMPIWSNNIGYVLLLCTRQWRYGNMVLGTWFSGEHGWCWVKGWNPWSFQTLMTLWFCERISMWYFMYHLFAKKIFIGRYREQFQLQSAGMTEQQWMKRWVWQAVKSRMNGSSKALCGEGLWVTSVEKCGEEPWFGKWERSQ